MEQDDLPFATIVQHKPDLAELIVNDRVELDGDKVARIHQYLLQHFQLPIRLLVNRQHRILFNYEGQQRFAAIPEIIATAFWAEHPLTELSCQVWLATPRPLPWNARVFSERQQALQWLNEGEALKAAG